MRRAWNPALVVLYLALAALPAFAMIAKLRVQRLEGAFPPARLPELSLAAVRSEAYQTQLVRWFESRVGLRAGSVRIDNTIAYHAFRETKWDSHVRIGSEGTLYERDDIAHYNKNGALLPGPGAFDQLAGEIARLQAAMRARGKGVVPIFVPSKTTFYPDKVSALWTRDLGAPRPSEGAFYRAMKRALEARGVVFVDGIELLLRSKESRDKLWGLQARHFSNYAGCLCVREILARHAELTGRPPIAYPCVYDARRAGLRHGDLDLFRLLNAWLVPRDPLARDVDHTPFPEQPEPHAPKAMWIATSFGWTMTGDAIESRRFPQVHLAYYNSTVYELGGPDSFAVKPFDDRWNEIYPTRDLYVLELFETYLAPANHFISDAATALLTALEREAGQR